MPIVKIPPINSNNHDEHDEALVNRQTDNDRNDDTFINQASFSIRYTVVVQYEDGGP